MSRHAIRCGTSFPIETVTSNAGFGCECIEKDVCGVVDQDYGDAGLGKSRTMRCSMKEAIKPGKIRARICVKRINGLNL